MMRDDKLVRVAIKSKQPVERVLWVWGAILESAAEIDDGGRFDFDAEEAAYFLRADIDDVLAVANALEGAGRLDGCFVVKWGDRQFQSDRSAERQRRYRERQKNSDSDGKQKDKSRNADDRVTSPSRHGDAPETETETETELDILEPKGSCASDDAPVLKPEHVVETWNDRFGGEKPKVRDLTPSRRQVVKARISQYSLDDFLLVFEKIERSQFLRDGSFCTFDWVMKAANFQKVIEGNYDKSTSGQKRFVIGV